MGSDKIIDVDGSNFEQEVLQSEEPVVVDFWAEWCGPCRMVAPTLEQLAEQYDGKLRFAKLNVDHEQEWAMRFQVSSIPTFILFKHGEVADRMLGAGPKSAFESFFERNLS